MDTPPTDRLPDLDDQPTNETPRPPKFSIGWIALVPAVLFMVSVVLVTGATTPRLDIPGTIAGAFLGGFLISAAIAWLFWRVAGRKQWVATLVFSVLLLLFSVGQLGQSLRSQQTREFEQKADLATARHQAKQKELLERAVAGDDIGHDSIANMDTMTDEFAAAAVDLKGDEALTAQAGVDGMRKLKACAADYQAALDALTASGGLSADGLTTIAAIDNRLELVTALAAANERLAEAPQRVVREAEQWLREQGAAERYITGFVEGFRQGLSEQRQNILSDMRQSDRDMLAAGADMLRLMKTSWGRWSYDTEVDQLVFDDDADADQYNAFAAKLTQAITLQQDAQRRMIELLQTNPPQ